MRSVERTAIKASRPWRLESPMHHRSARYGVCFNLLFLVPAGLSLRLGNKLTSLQLTLSPFSSSFDFEETNPSLGTVPNRARATVRVSTQPDDGASHQIGGVSDEHGSDEPWPCHVANESS